MVNIVNAIIMYYYKMSIQNHAITSYHHTTLQVYNNIIL